MAGFIKVAQNDLDLEGRVGVAEIQEEEKNIPNLEMSQKHPEDGWQECLNQEGPDVRW
jgi:hypothetical protein